jgi:phage shock protein A
MVSAWQEWTEKIGTKLHAIVDRALENSSVALYDQSLRDMEDYIHHVEEAAISMKAAAEGNKRHMAQYQSEAEILDTRLNQLLMQNQTEQSHRVQQALNIKRQQIANTQVQIERQEEQHDALVHNWQMLKERLRVLQGERGSVVALVARANAERAISSIEYTLGGLTRLGSDSEIGTMAGHILQRLDEAEARLELVDVDAEVARAAAAIEEVRVEEQLEERRRRLGLVEEVQVPPETSKAEAQVPSEEEATTEAPESPQDALPKAAPAKPAQEEQPETTKEPPATPER